MEAFIQILEKAGIYFRNKLQVISLPKLFPALAGSSWSNSSSAIDWFASMLFRRLSFSPVLFLHNTFFPLHWLAMLYYAISSPLHFVYWMLLTTRSFSGNYGFCFTPLVMGIRFFFCHRRNSCPSGLAGGQRNICVQFCSTFSPDVFFCVSHFNH